MKKYRPFLVAASILCFGVVVLYSDPATFLPILYRSNVAYLAAGILVMTLSVIFRVMKWGVLLPVSVPVARLMPVQLVGINVSNFTPGKIAEPVKTLLLKARHNIPVSDSLPSVIWERVIDLCVMIFFSVALLLGISVSRNVLYLGVAGITLFFAAIMVVVAVLKNRAFGEGLFRVVRFFPVLKKIDGNFLDRFYSSRTRKTGMIKCVVLTAAAWFLDGVVFYLAFMSIGIEINPLLMAGVVSFSMLLGVASFLPGGIGSTEIVMVVIFGLLGLEGSVAFAGMILARLMTFWYVVLLGGLALLAVDKGVKNS